MKKIITTILAILAISTAAHAITDEDIKIKKANNEANELLLVNLSNYIEMMESKSFGDLTANEILAAGRADSFIITTFQIQQNEGYVCPAKQPVDLELHKIAFDYISNNPELHGMWRVRLVAGANIKEFGKCLIPAGSDINPIERKESIEQPTQPGKYKVNI